MFNYEISVKGLETYYIEQAKSKEEAIDRAIGCFMDDDEWYGSKEAENVTEDDCEVMWFEEI